MTLIGGMTTATLLTLLVVPVFYTLFDDAPEHHDLRAADGVNPQCDSHSRPKPLILAYWHAIPGRTRLHQGSHTIGYAVQDTSP